MSDRCVSCGRSVSAPDLYPYPQHADGCALAAEWVAAEPLVLEHDPERGCLNCPLLSDECAAGGTVGRGEELTQPALADCPLRTGHVLIRTPESADE